MVPWSECHGGIDLTITGGETRFFCKPCNTFYQPNEVEVIFSSDYTQRKSLCPKCKGRLTRICQICDQGKMLVPEKPVSGDYDVEGFLECFCTNCGSGFIKSIIINDNVKFYISKRDIKSLVDKVFTRKHIPYNEKTNIENKIVVECKTRSQIMDLLIKDFNEDRDFLDKEIIGKYVSF